MSKLRKNNIRKTQYRDTAVIAEMPEEKPDLSIEDQELAARIEERRRRTRKNSARKKRRTVVLMILIFAALLTMCSREIVRLKAENLALQRQHAQLEQERDRLTKELGRVNDKEYIKQQARKQLRLLDPGEKMFIFEEKKDNDTDKTKIEEAEEAKGENPDG